MQAEMMRALVWRSFVPPTRRKVPSCSTRRILDCMARLMEFSSSRNSVYTSGVVMVAK